MLHAPVAILGARLPEGNYRLRRNGHSRRSGAENSMLQTANMPFIWFSFSPV
jgi:hypothetical protein